MFPSHRHDGYSFAMPSTRHIVLWALLVEGSLGVLGLLLGWWFGIPVLSFLVWDRASILWGTLSAIPLSVGFVLFYHRPVGTLRRIRQILDETLLSAFGQCGVLELAIIALSAGVGEEILFRGYLQVQVIQWTGSTAIGLCVASILFGLAHLITATYAILATAIGLLLGGLMLATESLVAPILAHALYDFLALVYAIKLVRVRSISSPEPVVARTQANPEEDDAP